MYQGDKTPENVISESLGLPLFITNFLNVGKQSKSGVRHKSIFSFRSQLKLFVPVIFFTLLLILLH